MKSEDARYGVDGGTGGMHGPRPLLGPDGQPLPKREALTEEVALPQLVGARAFWDQTVASGLTPQRLASLLHQSVRGDIRAYLTLAEEMEERDLHYQGVLGVRKRAIAGIKPTVNEESAKGADGKITEFVRELIVDPMFADLIEDLMDAIGKGFSVAETIWTERGGLFVPQRYVHRDPRYFTFDYVSRTDIRLADIATIDGLPLPEAKFIRHLPRLKTGIPIRAGVARISAWAFMLKSFALKNWASFLDIYGMPLRVGKYHPNATEAERRTLLRAVASIASDAAAIIPESMLIDFIEAKHAGSPSYEDMARYIDEQVSKVVLGQTMSTDHGSSRAQAQVHNEVRFDILEWDGRQLARTINRDLIAWAVKLNFGDQAHAPIVEFPMPKREDVAVKSSALAQLVPLGLKIDQDDVRDMIGMPKPKENADLLTPPAAGATDNAQTSPETKAIERQAALNMRGGERHVRGCQCGGCLALNDQRYGQPIDMIDEIGLDESADWEAQTGPLVKAIIEAAEAADGYDDFKRRLDRLAADLNTDPLAKRLVVSMLKARAVGIATDDV